MGEKSGVRDWYTCRGHTHREHEYLCAVDTAEEASCSGLGGLSG